MVKPRAFSCGLDSIRDGQRSFSVMSLLNGKFTGLNFVLASGKKTFIVTGTVLWQSQDTASYDGHRHLSLKIPNVEFGFNV